jgi:putative ABC transport system permease protein
MRDDYQAQQYDVLKLVAGTWPAKGDLAVERLSSQSFGIDIGGSVILELDKTDRPLPVAGIIRSSFVHPPDFGGPAIFYTDAQGLERFNIAPGEFSGLAVRVSPYSDDLARTVASEIKDRLGKAGVGVTFTTYQDPEKHWARMFVEGITVVLQALAIIALLTSVVLVTNTMSALVAQQTDQIGLIKAIGGSTGVILKLYLTTVLIYGLLAFVVALPLGTLVAFGMSKWFLNAFNIDYELFRISARAISYQALAATLVPILAALWPVLKGAAMTAQAAMATYGLGSDFGSNRLDQTVERIGSRLLSSPYAVALGNLFRRKGRLILTQVALIGAGTMFLSVMALSASLLYTVDTDMARRGYDISIGFDQSQSTPRVFSMLEPVPGISGAELWYTTAAAMLEEDKRLKEAGIGAQVVGIPAGSAYYRPLIVAGRWLAADDGRAIVISKDMADDNSIAVGDTVTLNMFELGHSDWQVVGVYQVIFSDGFDLTSIYAPLEALAAATKQYNEGNRLLIRTKWHELEPVAATLTQLKDLFEARNMSINVYAAGTTPEDRVEIITQFTSTTTMLLVLAVIVAMVGGIGLMGALSISVVERTREIGVMRAVGGRSQIILGMFMLEGLLQGLLSWLLAVLLSFSFFRPLASALGQAMFGANLDYRYDTGAVLIWLGIILIIAALSSLLPARSATRISVRQSLAYV